MNLLKKNYYNFDFIIKRLDGFITPETAEEIDLFKKLGQFDAILYRKHIYLMRRRRKSFMVAKK